jgi:hypothetical protein
MVIKKGGGNRPVETLTTDSVHDGTRCRILLLPLQAFEPVKQGKDE